MKLPKSYADDAERLKQAIEMWIFEQSCTRLVDLKFHKWGKVVHIGPLSGHALAHLAASPDAREMLEWADAATGKRATLLQAYAVLVQLGHIDDEAVPRAQPS